MGKKSRGGQLSCFHCRQKGHAQNDCPLLLSEGGGRCCFHCSSPDHEGKECPLAPKPVSTKEEEEASVNQPRIKRVVASDGPCTSEASSSKNDLTVVITTSPVPSNPSTMMLEAVLQSFNRVKGLGDCALVIVCDGYNFAAKSTWKAGKVTEDAAERYLEYLQNLESMLNSGKLPAGTKLVILDGRNGQALALRAGLQQVDTEYVLIHQHDLEFMFDFNLPGVLSVLDDPANDVKYVGMPLLCNINYEPYILSHHGVRVEPLALQPAQGGEVVRVVPIIFWYDSTHISSVRHYEEVVFGCGEVFRPGDFIEETYGVRQRKDIMEHSMAAHAKYGTYHLISHSANQKRRPIICHLGGSRFLTPDQRAERGYPPETSVSAWPTRVMTRKGEFKVRTILDRVLELANVPKQDLELKQLLATQLHLARLRGSVSASQCLAQTHWVRA